MGIPIFGSFAQMVDELPAEGICRALKIECQMLLDDWNHQSVASVEDAISIQSFRMFVQTAQDQERIRCIYILPGEHVIFYRKTVERLIAVGELLPDALKHFDETFLVKPDKKIPATRQVL